jgi:hypothetical protein
MSEILYEKAIKLVNDVNDIAKLINSIRINNIYNDGVKKFELMSADQELLKKLKTEITLNARSLNTLLNQSRSGQLRKFKDYTCIHDINSYLANFLIAPSFQVLQQLETALQFFQEDTDLFFFPVMKRDHDWSSYSKIAQAMLAYRRSPVSYKEIKRSAIEIPVMDQDLSASVFAADEDFELTSETAEIRTIQEKLSKIDIKGEKQQNLIDLQLDEQEFESIFAAVAAKRDEKYVPENEKVETVTKFVRTEFSDVSKNNFNILDTGFSLLFKQLQKLKSCFFDFKTNANGEDYSYVLKNKFFDTHKIKKHIRELINAIEDKFNLELSEYNVLFQLNVKGVEPRDKKKIYQFFLELMEEAHHFYRLAYFKYVNIEETGEEYRSDSEQQDSSVRR